MEDAEREAYEQQLAAKDDHIADLMEQLGDAVGLLKEISNMAKGI